MDVLGVIPARYGSSRFPGKILADILGKPMIQWVFEAASKVKLLDEIIIACDDERILNAAKGFGAKAVLTSKDYACGSDRIAEIVNPIDTKIVVNIQADEPLLHPTMIDTVSRALLDNENVVMSTLKKEITDIDELNDPNVVKVVTDKDGFALYFSRSAIPSPEREIDKSSPILPKGFFKHIGLYAYTKDFLFTLKKLPLSNLEKIERLEQLRVLENGYKIKVLETSFETIGVDTPQDLKRVISKLSGDK